ncbi:hypothetical protein C0993_009811 [Termitomyces sp. T159_Od127]|nr:hypothetical protein C0993_009811 [Termitomyces sp. T159_Od127]
MSKRPKSVSDSLGNLKVKRARPTKAKDQQSIHDFFSSPRKCYPVQDFEARGSPGLRSPSKSYQSPTAHIIDVDALDDSDQSCLAPKSNPLIGPFVHSKSTKAGAELSSANERPVYGDLTYDPATQTTIEKPWSSPSVPYSFLAHTLSALARTRSRITINNILTNCLYCIIRYDPQALLPAIYLLSNTLAPPYTSLELGLGPSIILRSIQSVSGLTTQAIKRLVNSTGDPGDVAFTAKSNLRTLLPHPPLLVHHVYTSLLKIARCKGQGTAKEKEKIVEKLLLAATGEEVRYLTRTLSQNLRVGAVRTTILLALSRAMVLTPLTHFIDNAEESSLHVTAEVLESHKIYTGSKRRAVNYGSDILAVRFGHAESLIKRIYVQHPNYEDIVMALLQGGLDSLEEKVRLTIGEDYHLKPLSAVILISI